MNGFYIGSQEWYNHTRQKLISINEKLESENLSDEERDELQNKAMILVWYFERFATIDHIVNSQTK